MSDTQINTEEKEETLENMMQQLEELIEGMQSSQQTLEETFADYKKGLELVEKCGKKIEKIECDIRLLEPEGE